MRPELFHKIIRTAASDDYKVINVSIINFSKLEIGLLEAYWVEPNCDCKHVFITVLIKDNPQPVSVISYGGESTAFYSKWMHADRMNYIASFTVYLYHDHCTYHG